jgi:superfamily II DNA or RNA helicase
MIQLRKFQEELISECLEATKKRKKRILLMAPTGSGKTVMAHAILKIWLSKGRNCLFTCHRRKLVDQTHARFSNLLPSVIMGRDQRYNPESRLQIGSLYTVKNREIATPNLILIDEVHYGYDTKLIQNLLDRFPDATVIGLSATPIDEKGFLLEGFDYYIDRYQIGDLIEMRWLLPPLYFCPIELDLSKVRLSARGEYDSNELEGVVIQEYLINTAVENYKKFGENRSFIGFAVSKKHGQAVAKAFNDSGVPVGYLDADTPDFDRKCLDEQFKDGVIRGIISIEILTTGADYPHCSCIVDMAPTKILRKYIQKGGRGTRLFGDSYDESMFNGKINFIYLDLSGAIKEHGLLEDRRKFKFKPKISSVIDRSLNIDSIDNAEERKALSITIDKERYVYLQKIGKALDIFEGKTYSREGDLMDDIRSFLSKTDLFWYRQNSGVAQYGFALDGELKKFLIGRNASYAEIAMLKSFIDSIKTAKDRFVRFTSVSGLADMSAFYRLGSVFFALEAKLTTGRLTTHQKKTFPELIESGILLFIVTSVYQVYEVLCHIEKNVYKDESGNIIIKSGIYDYPDFEKQLYSKFSLELPKCSKVSPAT